jgi:predicted  nucleic acid-binding Zn-ribbon protein
LNRKADELDTLKLDMIDINDSINRMIENLEKDLRQSDEELHKDMLNRIEGWVASTDRRFDKTYNEIHKLNETVGVSKKSY